MDSPTLDKVLNEFASSTTVEQLTRISHRLLKEKLVNKARHDERFQKGVANCVALVRTEAPDREKLQALATAYRLGATSKPVAKMVRNLTEPALKNELPPLDLLPDGEDRYYASLAILDADGDWVAAFTARGIAREETAEKARTTLARRLVSLVPIADALSYVASELNDLTFQTENPAESAARRLRRVIAAFRSPITDQPVPPGEDLGSALYSLFVSPFKGARSTPDAKTTERLAEECCGLVYDILRTQISVVAEPSIYRSLAPVRKWIGPRLWPRFISSSASGTRVLSSLESALVLLGKQGVTDKQLLETLELFTGSRDEARRRSAQLSAEHPELDDEVREWLSRMGRTRSTPYLSSMDEARESSSDELVAALLVAAYLLRTQSGELSPLVKQLVTDAETLASARGLAIRLEPGDVVDYSPAAHHLTSGSGEGGRKVHVLRPLVERQNPDGVVKVIQKALVDPSGGGHD